MKSLPYLLIVDDSEENLVYLETVLKDTKVNLIKALSGAEALEKIKGIDVALAIIDVRMPEMNGYELIKKMNDEKRTDKVPVIFLTASHFLESQISQGYTSGAVDYIIKPIDNYILRCKVKIFIDQHIQKQRILTGIEELKISAEKLAQTNVALRASEESYRTLFNSIVEGVVLIAPDGQITHANPAAEKILGLSLSKIKSFRYDSPSWQIIRPDRTPMPPDEFAAAKAMNEKIPIKDIVMGVRRPDRFISWVNVNAVPLFSETDELQGIVVTFTDITIRTNAEEALFANETRLKKTQEIAHLGTWELDLKTRELIWSDEVYNIFGLRPQEFTPTQEAFLSHIHPEDRAKVNSAFLTSLNEGSNEYNIEHRIINKINGEVRYVEQKCEHIRESSGKVIRSLGMIHDITDRKLNEMILKESEANLTEAQRIAHLGSWEWNMDANEVKWSAEMYRIFNISSEEFDKKPESVIQFIHPDDVPSFTRSLQTNLSDGSSPILEYRIVHKDGSVHYIYAEGRTIFGKSGKPSKAFGTVQDITDRRLADEALRKSEELFRSLVYNSSSLMTLTDANGTITFVGPQCSSVIGHPSSKLIGQKMPDIIFPEDARKVKQAWENVIINGQNMYDFEYRIFDKDGTIRWLSHTAMMIKIDENVLGIQSIVRNITRHKIADQALKVSEEKYRTMLNASPDGIFITNLKGLITEVSEIGLELFGSDNINDLTGKHFLRFVPHDEKKTVKEIIEKTMNEGLAQNVEIKIRKKTQALFLSETSATLIQGPDGSPYSFMVTLRDISQRKKMEKKQIHADRMASLGEMASGIAHEINQPLNTISLVLDNIIFESNKEQNLDISYLKRKSDKIFENITRIRNIIDHVRAFSRSQDDYLLTGFDINSSIENAISMISEQFKHLAINMKLKLETGLPHIIGNTFKFEQVILNLLSNAKDALLEKTINRPGSYEMTIEINSYQATQSVVVEITDNGAGITDEDIEHIMLPFYTTKDSGKGTGLGLSISYQIIKEMNGYIEISSNPLFGTTFKIILHTLEEN